MINEDIVKELFGYFKENYGFKIENATDLFDAERNLLEFLVRIGRRIENKFFEEIGTEYLGNIVEKDGKEYEFKDYREKSIHGLFGVIEYRRAYYVSREPGQGSFIPLDEKLGIDKKHTPGCNYFFSFFTGQDVYQESLDRFHEIFRPDGTGLLSMRKVLDMDYELGDKLEGMRQREIEEVFEEGQEIEKEEVISGTMAVSIDATKVREKLGEELDENGKKTIEIGFKDAKIAGISLVEWDEKEGEAVCVNTSYVTGIEYADDFFRRIWVEMTRRSNDTEANRIVFLGDGATWIWDRTGDIGNDNSIEVLDFYHASEHISDVCKALYGEQTQPFKQHYDKWRGLTYEGEIDTVLSELKRLRDTCEKDSLRDELQGEISYFETNRDRMHYDEYRKMGIPIGSGVVESACKHVIGKRLKLSGMTWSPAGARGMLQIRSSLKSNRFQKDFRRTLADAA